MCDALQGNITTTSNSFTMCTQHSSVNVIGYVSSCRRLPLIDIFLKFRQAAGLGLPSLDGFYFFLAITAVTVLLNFVTAILITLRILYLIRETVGLESKHPYIRIITICVESSALIVVFGLIYLILYFKANNASIVPLELLVHVYV